MSRYALELERNRTRQILDSQFGFVALLDLDGTVVDMNQASIALSGRSREELLGLRLWELSEFDATAAARVREAFGQAAEGNVIRQDLAARFPERGHLDIDAVFTPLRDPDGRIVNIMAFGVDITDRKRVERALQESEEKYRSLVESAHDAIYTSDADGRFLYANRAAAAAFGLTPAQVVGKFVDDFFPPPIGELFRIRVRKAIETGEDIITEQDLEIGGQLRSYSIVVQRIHDGGDGTPAAQMIAREITSLRQAEQARRENEERLRQVVRVSHIGIFDHDHRTGAIYWSPEQREIYGWDADEPVTFDTLIGESSPAWNLIHPDDRDRVRAALKHAHTAEDGLFDIEYRIVRRDGSVRWVVTRSQTIFDGEGAARRPTRTIGAVEDITDRKLAERQLELAQASMDKSNISIFWLSPAGEVTYANEHACQSLGLNREALIGRNVWDFDPDYTQALWNNDWQHLKRHRLIQLESRHQRSDGTIFPIEATGAYVTFQGEEHAFVFSQDITARQSAERELKLMLAAIGASRTPFYALDTQDRFVYVNEYACRDLGHEPGALLGRTVADIDPDARPDSQAELWRKLRAAGEIRFQTRHRRKDGTTFPVEVTANLFSYKDEEYSLVFAQDITERIKAEEAMRESEERLRQVALVYDIGTFDHDHRTNEVYWSPELRATLGFSADEPAALEKFVATIHPEDYDRVAVSARRSYDPAGDGRLDEQYRVIRRDGAVRWLEVRSQTFFDGEWALRRPARTVGAMVDITARVAAHEALQESLREKETLLREVHHRVKNNLQIIASLLHFQAKKIRNPEDLAAFSEGRDRLRSMILVHEKLYQSRGLARIEFGNYLRSLTSELQRSHGARTGKRIDVKVTAEEIALPIEAALPCGMIVCELLTNVFKYAYPGDDSGTARIDLKAQDGRIRLSVSDDGVGLPPEFNPMQSASFGWQLIHNLSTQLDGTMSVSGTGGTRVEISFPQPPAGT